MEFIARVLAAPGAVWWGCICAWHPARANLSAAESGAFRALVNWVQKPTEENRRAAEAAGAAAGMSTPAGALASAAVWSSGSMSPPGLPEVLPPPDLTAATVVAALRLAAGGDDKELPRFVRLARPLLEPLPSMPQPEPKPDLEGSVGKMWNDTEAIVGRPPTPRRAAPTAVPKPPEQKHARPTAVPKPPEPKPKKRAPDEDSWGGMSAEE